MSLVHGIGAITDAYLASSLIGYAVGLAITMLLLAFSLRAAKLPGTPVANIVLAVCGLLWNAGGFSRAALLASGFERPARLVLFAAAVQFSAAAVWPVPMLAVWRHFTALRWQRTIFGFLGFTAALTGAVMSACLWTVPVLSIELLPHLAVKEFTAFNASIFLAAGAGVLLVGPAISRRVQTAALVILLAVVATAAAILLLNRSANDILLVVSEQAVLFVVLGAFFLFGRFRFADVFIHQSARILLAGAAAIEPPL